MLCESFTVQKCYLTVSHVQQKCFCCSIISGTWWRKQGLPSQLSDPFSFWGFETLRMPGRLKNDRAGKCSQPPACISSCLLLRRTCDATIKSQGCFGSYTGELGQLRTKPQTDAGCAYLPVHRDTKPLLTCLDIRDGFVLMLHSETLK